MATRKTTTVEETQDDVIDQGMKDDVAATAGDLADVLEDLRGLTGSDVEVLIYRVPKGGIRGGWEFVKAITPPVDTINLMDELRDQWGAGEYVLRVRAAGKIKSTKFINIANPKNAPVIAPSKDTSSDMIQLLIAQNAAAKSDMMQMTTLMMQSQQASQQQMMQLMTVLLPAMMGGKEKTSELMTAFAAMTGAGDKGGGLKEAIETLALAKGLFSNEGGGGADIDPDASLVSNAIKLAGPLLGGLAKAAGQKQETVTVVPPVHQNPAAPAMLPIPPAQPATAGEIHTPDQVSRFPVLDLIRDDVLFLFKRQHDPELSAEVIAETLDKNNIPEEAITDVVAAFTLSPNWIEDLAGEGIDLRSNPEWANQFLTALVGLYTASGGGDDYSGGGSGGAQNHAGHGATVPDGVADNADPQPSGDAD